MRAGLSEQQAHAIYDVLVEEAGVRESSRQDFVHHQTSGHISEYRIGGIFGFGGKFWRTSGRDTSGEWVRDLWRVNYYPEDSTPLRDRVEERINERLNDLRAGDPR